MLCVVACHRQLCGWVKKVAKDAHINLMDTTSSNDSAVQGNILLTFFAEGAHYDEARATVAWQGGGAHPSLADTTAGLGPGGMAISTGNMPPEGVPPSPSPSDDRIQISCIAWEDTDNLLPGSPKPATSKRHARYVIRVTGPNVGPYELRKRWQELSDLSRNLYEYDRYLGRDFRWTDNGEKPLPSKRTSAGYDSERLDSRKMEVHTFVQHLASWMTLVLTRSKDPTNLLSENTDGPQRRCPTRIYKFLKPDAGYDPGMDTIRDVSSLRLGASGRK